MFIPDTNGDGIISPEDLPNDIKPGSPEARAWWKQVDSYTKNQITEAMKAKYGDRVIGAYNGKALVPGEAGSDQGDFSYLVDKLQITQGLSQEAATRIAAKIKLDKYGV